MKAHIIEILIIDHEDYGVDDYIIELEQSDMNGSITKHKTIDIGEWSDDHPLNKINTNVDEWIKNNER